MVRRSDGVPVVPLDTNAIAATHDSMPRHRRDSPRDTTQGGDAYGASGTSFYTTTEKQDSYDSLDKVLDAKCKDAGVRKVIVEMLDACGEITEALRSALVTVCVKINFRGARGR